MARIPPPGRRSISRHTPDGLEILIPSQRNVFLMLFLSAWLVGWGFGEVMAARELLFGNRSAPDLFLAAWLILWTLGGAAAVYAWLRMLAGREVIVLGGGVLTIKAEVFGVGRRNEYDVAHIKNLRVEPPAAFSNDMSGAMRFWGIGGGPVAFDYGSKTLRLGAGLDDAEARDVIRELREQHAFPESASR